MEHTVYGAHGVWSTRCREHGVRSTAYGAWHFEHNVLTQNPLSL